MKTFHLRRRRQPGRCDDQGGQRGEPSRQRAPAEASRGQQTQAARCASGVGQAQAAPRRLLTCWSCSRSAPWSCPCSCGGARGRRGRASAAVRQRQAPGRSAPRPAASRPDGRASHPPASAPEHADLLGDEGPVLVGVDLDQLLVQRLPHRLDAPRHHLRRHSGPARAARGRGAGRVRWSAAEGRQQPRGGAAVRDPGRAGGRPPPWLPPHAPAPPSRPSTA